MDSFHSFLNSKSYAWAMSAALIFERHGALLRALSDHAGEHFQGLAVASRRSLLPNKLKQKLLRFECAYNVVRHIMKPSAGAFVV